MRVRNKPLTLAAVAVLAVAVTTTLTLVPTTQDRILVAILAVLVASLAGSYALRHHARKALAYDRARPRGEPGESEQAAAAAGRARRHHHGAEEHS